MSIGKYHVQILRMGIWTNAKSEIRNPKQILMSKIQIFKTPTVFVNGAIAPFRENECFEF